MFQSHESNLKKYISHHHRLLRTWPRDSSFIIFIVKARTLTPFHLFTSLLHQSTQYRQEHRTKARDAIYILEKLLIQTERALVSIENNLRMIQ